jgi:hypothetical protein
METFMQILLGGVGAMVGLIVLHKLFPKVVPGASDPPPPFPLLLEYWALSTASTYAIWKGLAFLTVRVFPSSGEVVFIPLDGTAYFLPALLLGLLVAGFIQEALIKRRLRNHAVGHAAWSATAIAPWVTPVAGSLSAILLMLMTQTRIEIHPEVALAITPFGGTQVVHQPVLQVHSTEAPMIIGVNDTLSLEGYRWEKATQGAAQKAP